MYFGQHEEDLIKEWQTCTDTRRQYEIYNALTPTLNTLIRNVIHKYFTLDDRETRDTVQEIVNHLYLSFHAWDKRKGNAFTFCTIYARNKISNKYSLRHSKKMCYEFLQTNDVIMECNEEIDYKEIIYNHLLNKISLLEQEASIIKNKRLGKRKSVLHHNIQIGYLLLNYVRDYDIEHLTYINMFDYIYHNYEASDWAKKSAMLYYLKYAVDVFFYKKQPDYLQKAEKDAVHVNGYENDDFTPNTSRDEIAKHRKFLKNNL